MGVNGNSRVEVWSWDTDTAALFLAGAIPQAFTGASDNAPVDVAAMDMNGDLIADAIFAVQGPIGTTGQIRRFDVSLDMDREPKFAFAPADPLTGFSGPWFIATSKPVPQEPEPSNAAPPIAIWTNPVNPFDVNSEGLVGPLDVLITINYINANPGVTALPAQQFSPPRYFDTNVDGVITPKDVLLVLNYLNSSAAGSGEGEANEAAGAAVATFADPGTPVAGLAAPAAPPSQGSTVESDRDQVLGAFAATNGPDNEWYLPEVEFELPQNSSSSKSALDDSERFDLESVLEEIGPGIAAI
jgi:hypothetical protein